jgi:hypothetical protein
MEDEKIDEAEVWSAIRYLDPDEQEKEKEANTLRQSQYYPFCSLSPACGFYFGLK